MLPSFYKVTLSAALCSASCAVFIFSLHFAGNCPCKPDWPGVSDFLTFPSGALRPCFECGRCVFRVRKAHVPSADGASKLSTKTIYLIYNKNPEISFLDILPPCGRLVRGGQKYRPRADARSASISRRDGFVFSGTFSGGRISEGRFDVRTDWAGGDEVPVE